MPQRVSVEDPVPTELRRQMVIEQVRLSGAIPDRGPDEWWQFIPAIFGLPVEDQVEPLQHAPWATWALAAIILCVGAATYSNLESVVRDYGLIPTQPWRHGGLTFLTSFFLHGGILHLLSNLYFLVVFGDNVEDYLGKGRFLLLIALSAIAGDVLHVMLDPRPHIPCVGASGGISGVILFYALQFPHAQLGLFTRWFIYFQWVRMPAYLALGFWLGLQVIGAWQQVSAFTNVSALAHLGGAGVGILYWLWLKMGQRKG